jgi:hypothetical protein
MKSLIAVGVAAVVAVTAIGATTAQPEDSYAVATAEPDTTGAAIWAHLQEENYRENWSLWPGTEAFYQGGQPHGMLLTTYVNDAALGALKSGASAMPDGAIVVKENYMPNQKLAAITVMYKSRGYNSEHNDWFFTKHLPSGELDQMEMNGMKMPMEGRLPGCQNCHLAKRDNDYLYTGELGSK